MGCGETLGRLLLSLINLIFFLASGLLLAFGITAKVSPSDIAKVFNSILPASARNDLQLAGVDIAGIVVSNAVFMIIVGAVGIVIAGIGFVGACCLVKGFLVSYAILMILLVLGEIALIVFAAVYTDSFKSVIQKGMYDSLSQQFRNDIKIYSNGSVVLPQGAVDIAWASIQIREKCCGAYNYSDYDRFNWNGVKTYYGFNGMAVVPITCCSYQGTDFPPKYSSFNNLTACLQGNAAFINQQNCYDAIMADIQNFIQQYKAVAIGIAAGIIGLELILIAISFTLCSHSNRSDKFV